MIKNVLKNVLKVSAAILLTAGIFSGCTAINDGGTFDYEQDFSSARSVSLNSTKRNVIYVSKLSDLKSSDLNAYTHICVAFAKLDFDVWVNPENDDDKRMIIGTVDGHLDKEAFKSKLSNFKTSDGAAVNSRKVLISLAGGDNEQAVAVYHTLQNSTRRANLINDLRDLTETYNLGGVDLDWEYFSSTFTKVNNYDKSSYDYSGIDVYTKCNNRYVYFVNHLVDDWVGEKPADGYRNTIITIAAQTGSKFTGDDAIRQMLTKLDFVSVMTYDYESSSKVSYTGDFNETKATIETYTGIVGAKNVNIGLPFLRLQICTERFRLQDGEKNRLL